MNSYLIHSDMGNHWQVLSRQVAIILKAVWKVNRKKKVKVKGHGKVRATDDHGYVRVSNDAGRNQ